MSVALASIVRKSEKKKHSFHSGFLPFLGYRRKELIEYLIPANHFVSFLEHYSYQDVLKSNVPAS